VAEEFGKPGRYLKRIGRECYKEKRYALNELLLKEKDKLECVKHVSKRVRSDQVSRYRGKRTE